MTLIQRNVSRPRNLILYVYNSINEDFFLHIFVKWRDLVLKEDVKVPYLLFCRSIFIFLFIKYKNIRATSSFGLKICLSFIQIYIMGVSSNTSRLESVYYYNLSLIQFCFTNSQHKNKTQAYICSSE